MSRKWREAGAVGDGRGCLPVWEFDGFHWFVKLVRMIHQNPVPDIILSTLCL